MPKSQTQKKLSIVVPESLQGFITAGVKFRSDSDWEKASYASICASELASYDNWQSRTWEFTRICKSLPELTHLSADEAFELIPWQETDFEEEDQIQFMTEWHAIRLIPGVDALKWAVQMAKKMPLNPPADSPYRRFKQYGKFLSLAGWLQVLAGKNPIFLPSRRVGELLDVSHTTIENLCKAARKDKLLELVEEHTRERAARYRFAVDSYRGAIERWTEVAR